MNIVTENRLSNQELLQRVEERLNTYEKELFYIMMSTVKTGGILYITSEPGQGKTSIIRGIARKLEIGFIDVRVSQKDESEVGLFPKHKEFEYVDDDGIKHVTDYVMDLPPEMAVMANKMTCIVIFEELNRGRREIRNAVLQVIQEREIGHSFKFNDDVFFVSTGNLEDDDTDTFSKALKGRCIHHELKFNYDYWVENFARANINPLILGWLNYEQTALKDEPKDDEIAYCSARSIDYMSNAMDLIFSKPTVVTQDLLNWAGRWASSYIGKKAIGFLQFLQDNFDINIWDIVDNFKKYEKRLHSIERMRMAQLLEELLKSEKTLLDFSEKQIKNIISLIRMQREENGQMVYIYQPDILIGFMKEMLYKTFPNKESLNSEVIQKNKGIMLFKQEFQKEITLLKDVE